jgi:VWFA-related protein
LAFAAVLTSQQITVPPFRTGVDVVQVDVSVLDKDRKPVKGLTAADFAIEVDGRAVPIATFTPVDLAARASSAGISGSAAWVKDVAPDVVTSDVPREGRLVVILFDATIRSVLQPLARQIAARAIDELAPDDLAAVAYVLEDRGVAFTRDRTKLLAAIEQPFPHFGDSAEWMATSPGSRSTPVSQSYYRGDIRDTCPGGCALEVLANIADALRDAPRRKMVLFLTTGVTIQTTGWDGAQVKTARDRLFRALDVANLTVHAIDPTALETLAPNADSITQSRISSNRLPIVESNIRRQQDVQVIPERTGGRAIMNANQPQHYLPAIFDESASYYMLAFRPSDPRMDGRFHKIEVKVKRKDLVVSARKGYYDGRPTSDAPDEAIAGLPPTIADVLTASWPTSDLPLRASVAAFAAPDGNRPILCTVIEAIPRPQETPAAASTGTEVEFVVAAFDTRGRSANYQRQMLAVTTAPGAPYEVLSKLPLDPGRYEIRIAASDRASGRTGSIFTAIDVPDFGKAALSLSGVVLDARPGRIVAPEDALRDVLANAPTARRELDRSDRATAFLRIYQGGQDALRPVQLTTRIQNSAGAVVHDATRSLSVGDFAKARSADYTFDIPLDALAPGEHLLTIEASERTRTERRDVRFTIR